MYYRVIDDVEQSDHVGNASRIVSCRDGRKNLILQTLLARHLISFFWYGHQQAFHYRWK